jgi:SAM-dependent methyltransferase
VTIESIYARPGLYDRALPRYEFSGATDEDLLRRELRQLAEDPVPAAVEIGCGTGRMTRILREHVTELTCVDASATMLAAFRKRNLGLTPVHADARDFLARARRSCYGLAAAFWSLNYPLLACFETSTGGRIIARDPREGRADAAKLLTNLTGVLTPGGVLLVFFFDPHSAEQRFVTGLWETIAPFPGTGRDFTRQLLLDHLSRTPGELVTPYHPGHMVAPSLGRAETWFLDGHFRSFPGLADDPQIRRMVRAFLAGHQHTDGSVRVPAGMHIIRFTRA